MRVAIVDGLVTLFYDGSKELYNSDLHDECFVKWKENERNHEGWEDWDLSNESFSHPWVQTEEWRRFIPGVRMYKGKKTFFYNGETLRDVDSDNDVYLICGQDE